MNRREALRNVALLMGGTIISSQTFLTSCVFEGQKEERKSGYSAREIALLNEIGETIIPATDTPGAKDANVGEFMVFMINDCYNDQQQETFKTGLIRFQKQFKEDFSVNFEDASQKDKDAFVGGLEREIQLNHHNGHSEQPEHFYRILKELTLLGYFTSEVGATKALSYQQTPGKYQACIPYRQGDKAWL